MFYISRLKDIKEMEYECEIVTPMFLGGAEPKKPNYEFRLSKARCGSGGGL